MDTFGNTRMNRFDIAEAYKWWDVLRDGNQLTEIRLLANDGRTASGIFDNIDEIVKAIAPYTNDWNIYYTINRLPDDVRGLPQYNKIIVRPKQTCNDNMMVARDYVCIDLDSRRLSGTNATDEQVEFTKKKANEVYQYLVNVGFNPPTVVFSSNGVHMYLRCAMLNNEKNTALVKRFLQALSMIFTDEHTDVDEKVFNCARIMRLPSTYSCKGNTSDASRPQRLCKFVKINENKVNDIAYFEKVAALYPEEEVRPSSQNNYSMESFDLDAFIEKHNIPVTKKVEVADGTRYYLEHCLFNDQHKGHDAILFKHRNGAVAYFCYHNSCSGNDWRKVREMYEPDAYTRKSTYQPHRSFRPIRQEIAPKELQEKEESKGNVWQCLSEIEDEDRSKIISIPSGITQYDKECCGFDKPSLSVWSGNNGSAKSTLLNQIALNAVNQGFKVAIYSGELRGKKMKRWLLYQAAGKQYNKKSTYNEYDYFTPTHIKDNIVSWLEGKLYNYNTRYSHNIEQVCLEVEKLVKEHQIDMLIMDNLSCLDIQELDGAINEQQKAAIKMLLRMTERMEIATHVVIHPKKSELYLRKNDVSGAKTLTDLADCVFFVHRWNQDTQKAAKEFMQPQVFADLCSSETTNIVEVIKHREFGEAEGHIYKLFYEPESRRLKNSIAETIHYGWEEEHVQTNIEQMTIENGVKESDLITPYSNEVAPF